MAILNKTELLAKVQEILGDNADDIALSLLDDITDTYDDHETRLKDTTDWEEKYKQNDNDWRERYKARFFNNDSSDDNDILEPKELELDDHRQLKFDDLFKED